MKTEKITLAGDVPGNSIELRVLRFEGGNNEAVSAYLQSSLHGSELPGQAALHFLIPMLERAESEGRVAGNITVVPQANPIGSAQWQAHQHLGRFDYFSGVNFNRSFPLLESFDTTGLPAIDAPKSLAERLKAQLLRLALPHEIVLDLHCDDESENYLYIHQAFLPEMYDLASALGSTAILSWDSTADAAFEEACAHPALHLSEQERKARAVTTVEFRGLNDVDIETGKHDADGLYRFLVHRGVIIDDSVKLNVDFNGPVTPLENVEMIRAPQGGMILFHVDIGTEVEAGAKLVTVVTIPGDPQGDITLTAPQAGRILTRRSHRYTRRGDDLLKLLGDKRSENARPGSLEA
ncbi:succinylglutamate desuccinylase/aspartoacylase family protein [Phyllobacterium zundukense]|uniref:Succinylglutamate desuccinylase/aspartoacylase family protein n=1 Tax=Phyllobacterium zundukense TaxID=1867719 RepID=A0ACD4D9Z4_9HYPH|nr:succinylglutamate desuccinylase/aspartoacylase family protein [Phyllobacterium zundukense]UXN62624.1 succinylglutamate desuccinylase/aspartoacylase family protein [Phyllobacterium zundukense]